MNPLTVFQRMKREWTPDRFLRGRFGDNDGRYCVLGEIGRITNEVYDRSLFKAAEKLLEQKLLDQNPELATSLIDSGHLRLVPKFNDQKDGYTLVMNAIDAILLEQMPAVEEGVTESTVDNRELVTV